eukprot:CAMPEP_0203864414 /NCGR_PEP_ID=MMETSP0359-20131031/14745_1 /ASSEMBLY_ACC=CAM_ASM_000338 /TAXON_ID=268821 /ORGANISM="Scrippsiella Hangoei, Strain SHTV-5" /LENGTH=407 /DNA_ID=CAMNT_0050782139 /DNA_START=84 /DNA_END=1307 /DNA_ORIENTATION=+
MASLLFHATDMASASEIEQSGRFRPGRKGFAGGAIYFSASYDEACCRFKGGKRNPEIVVECEVLLGRIFEAGRWTMNQRKCSAAGYDSVKIVDEEVYAVYDPNRITIRSFRSTEETATELALAPASTAAIQVEWCGRQLGLVSAELHQVIKAASNEFFQTGDVVKAVRKLTCADGDDLGTQVQYGAQGTLVSDPRAGADWSIRWHGRSFRKATVSLDQVAKCEPKEFLAVGDVVTASFDLHGSVGDASVRQVREGALGVLKSFRASGELAVEWVGQSLVTSTVLRDYIQKCKSRGYLRVGDVVKANCDLHYPVSDASGPGMIKRGELGTLKSTDPLTIDWWGRSLGLTAASKDQFVKCHPREYIVSGDVVKAAFDLDYGSIGFSDSEGGIVRTGSLGIVRSGQAAHV